MNTMMRSPAWIAVVAAVAALAGCSGASRGVTAATAPIEAVPAGAPVRIGVAESRNVPVDIAAVGNVEAWSTITVKALVGGTLMRAYFEEGQIVNKGDLLFEIYQQPYIEAVRQWEANLARERALLEQSQANLARAQAQEAHYGKEAERYARLAKEGIFSQEQSDQAAVQARSARTSVRAELAAIESAKAAIAADEAALATAKLNLSYCTLASPITGRTGSLKVKPGNLIKANDVDLVVIHQIQPVYVSFSVPEENLTTVRRRLGSGQQLAVQASIPGDTQPPPNGVLTFIENAVDTTTGTIRLKAKFPNADSRLWPGQFVDVRLRLEDRAGAIVVPSGAVQTGQQGNFVYVVKADSTVELRNIKPGPRLDTFTSLQGVSAGERVVTEGQLRLAPGMKVAVMQ